MDYDVYILIKDGKIIYVGCTSNLSKRVLSHRKDKDFDSVSRLYFSDVKRDALRVERLFTMFVGQFCNPELLNFKSTTKENGTNKFKIIRLNKN